MPSLARSCCTKRPNRPVVGDSVVAMKSSASGRPFRVRIPSFRRQPAASSARAAAEGGAGREEERTAAGGGGEPVSIAGQMQLAFEIAHDAVAVDRLHQR